MREAKLLSRISIRSRVYVLNAGVYSRKVPMRSSANRVASVLPVHVAHGSGYDEGCEWRLGGATIQIDGRGLPESFSTSTRMRETGVRFQPPSTVRSNGKLGVPLSLLDSGERSVGFELNDPKVSFKAAALSPDNDKLLGDWKQGYQDIPVATLEGHESPSFKKGPRFLPIPFPVSFLSYPSNAVRAPWPERSVHADAVRNPDSAREWKDDALGSGMSHERRVAVAGSARPCCRYSGPRGLKPAQAVQGPSPSPLWNGWGVDLSNSRFQPAESGPDLVKSQISQSCR